MGAERKQVAVVIGAGEGIGGAIAEAFAREGYVVCAARRSGDKLAPLKASIEAEGGVFHGYSLDARKEEDVVAFFDEIERDIGDLAVSVINPGANVPMNILDTTSRKFFKIWEMACFAGFLCGRESARHMLKHGRGTILFTGATASIRGAAGFAAFASAKHGLRAVAQSMARELQPQNIHVAHVVIDAAVDTPFIRDLFGEQLETMDQDAIVNPKDLAANYVMLHQQPKNAWTFEMDVRPFCEKW